MKPLVKNVDLDMQIWIFNYIFMRVLGDFSFYKKKNTLSDCEILLEVTRGPRRFSLLLLGFSSSYREVLSILGSR